MDDFDRIKISDRYRWKILSIVREQFNYVIITSDSLIDVSEATSAEAAEILSDFPAMKFNLLAISCVTTLCESGAQSETTTI